MTSLCFYKNKVYRLVQVFQMCQLHYDEQQNTPYLNDFDQPPFIMLQEDAGQPGTSVAPAWSTWDH